MKLDHRSYIFQNLNGAAGKFFTYTYWYWYLNTLNISLQMKLS